MKVFKNAEKAALFVQEAIHAEQRNDSEPEPRQWDLFSRKLSNHHHTERLLSANAPLTAALRKIEPLCVKGKRVPFDEIWDTAMAFPLVWDSDVNEWVAERQRAGRVNVLNLKPMQRVPQWEEGHVIEFLR